MLKFLTSSPFLKVERMIPNKDALFCLSKNENCNILNSLLKKNLYVLYL